MKTPLKQHINMIDEIHFAWTVHIVFEWPDEIHVEEASSRKSVVVLKKPGYTRHYQSSICPSKISQANIPRNISSPVQHQSRFVN